MIALYIASSARGIGKTALCCGLGKHFIERRKKVGYFKPAIGTQPANTDPDASLVKDILALDEPLETISVVFTDRRNLEIGIKGAYSKVSLGKDVVLIEGILEDNIAEALAAKVVIIEGYSKKLGEAVAGHKNFDSLLGVVVNKVPANRLEYVRGEIAPRFSQAGINVLGILPETRSLMTVSISELAERIQGKFLSGANKSAGLVENIMLGPMSIDSGLHYFGRKDNKVAIIESERPDMQLAALNTSVKCLVLAGDKAPQPVVVHFAEDKEVPVILAKSKVTDIVANIETAMSESRFSQEKLPGLQESMKQHFNFGMLDKALGF